MAAGCLLFTYKCGTPDHNISIGAFRDETLVQNQVLNVMTGLRPDFLFYSQTAEGWNALLSFSRVSVREWQTNPRLNGREDEIALSLDGRLRLRMRTRCSQARA